MESEKNNINTTTPIKFEGWFVCRKTDGQAFAINVTKKYEPQFKEFYKQMTTLDYAEKYVQIILSSFVQKNTNNLYNNEFKTPIEFETDQLVIARNKMTIPNYLNVRRNY